MGLFFTNNRSVKGLFFIQIWVCFRSVFSFFGSVLDLAALQLLSIVDYLYRTLFPMPPGQLVLKSEIRVLRSQLQNLSTWLAFYSLALDNSVSLGQETLLVPAGVGPVALPLVLGLLGPRTDRLSLVHFQLLYLYLLGCPV